MCNALINNLESFKRKTMSERVLEKFNITIIRNIADISK